MTDKKSDDYYIDIPEGISKSAIQDIVANAAEQSGLYISHIGGYSRSKYPNSVHWHFKRSPQETGLLDILGREVIAVVNDSTPRARMGS